MPTHYLRNAAIAICDVQQPEAAARAWWFIAGEEVKYFPVLCLFVPAQSSLVEELWARDISNSGTVGLSGRHSGNNQSSGGGSECVVFRMEVGGTLF